MELKITTLIENNPGTDKRLAYEHGLSLYIEFDNKKILFDTGQTGMFLRNAKLMEISMDKLDYIVLSHGHYDHSGGMPRLMEIMNPDIPVITGKGFFTPKTKKLEDGGWKPNGNPFEAHDLKDRKISVTTITEDVTALTDNILVFKNFIRSNDFETIDPHFHVRTENGTVPDDFRDEIALGLKTEQGLVVIVGCSHRGIINILTSIHKSTGMKIRAVIGGTHLVHASQERIERTLEALDQMDLEKVAVSHCTGEAVPQVRDHFREKFIFNCTGNIIEM